MLCALSLSMNAIIYLVEILVLVYLVKIPKDVNDIK